MRNYTQTSCRSLASITVEYDERGYPMTPVEVAEKKARQERQQKLKDGLGFKTILDEIENNTQGIKSLTQSLEKLFLRINNQGK